MPFIQKVVKSKVVPREFGGCFEVMKKARRSRTAKSFIAASCLVAAANVVRSKKVLPGPVSIAFHWDESRVYWSFEEAIDA